MIKTATIAGLLLLSAIAVHAGEPCHLAKPAGIICSRGPNAAQAAENYGAELYGTALGAYLQQFNCGRMITTSRIEILQRGRVAVASGTWRSVAQINVTGWGAWFIDDSYLLGSCPAPKPTPAP